MKTLIQCDFDGTITEKDVSFLLLDNFSDGDWRQIWNDYAEGRISVGAFNKRAFATIKVDKQTLLDFIFQGSHMKVRSGFQELFSYCSRKELKFVIVSNGLDFYIDAILKDMGIEGIEVFAAKSWFRPSGMDVKYIGPDGREIEDSFKLVHAEMFKCQGYDIIYAGNGLSDIYPAKLSSHVFATGDLLKRCQEINLDCTPFDNLNDIVRGLDSLSLG